jgi:hypothetical protein
MSDVRRHPLLYFFVLAYALSWVDWIPLAVAGVWTARDRQRLMNPAAAESWPIASDRVVSQRDLGSG